MPTRKHHRKQTRSKGTRQPNDQVETKDQTNTSDQPGEQRPKECLFDLTPDNIDMLSQYIVSCVTDSIDLICYSQESIKRPDLSITEIPGLSILFIKACLQQGLLGYLDWKQENVPTEQNGFIINNIIIATCGERVTDHTLDNEKGLAHVVDAEKLKYIRTMSRQKFNQLMNFS